MQDFFKIPHKFDINQEVFTLYKNKIVSGTIDSIRAKIVPEEIPLTSRKKLPNYSSYCKYYIEARTERQYANTEIIVKREEEVFDSLDSLLKSLRNDFEGDYEGLDIGLTK